MAKKQSLAEISKANRDRDAARFAPPPGAAPLAPIVGVESKIEWWPVELIDDNPFQPRSVINPDELEDLKASINSMGMRQIGEARLHPDIPGRVQLVFAHRRKAAVLAGANAGAGEENPDQYRGLMPLRVYVKLTKSQMLRRAIDENEKRVDVSALDKARSLLKLREIVTEELLEAGAELEIPLPDGKDGDEPEDGADDGRKLASWRVVARESGDPGKWRQMQRSANLMRLPESVRDLLDKKLLNERQCRGLVSMLGTLAESALPSLASKISRLRLPGETADKLAREQIEAAVAGASKTELERLADKAAEEAAKASAKDSKAKNKGAVAAGTSFLTLVPAGDVPAGEAPAPWDRHYAKFDEGGRLVPLPVERPEGEDANKRWAEAIVRARLQPAALLLSGARDDLEAGEWTPAQKVALVGVLEHVQTILDQTKRAL